MPPSPMVFLSGTGRPYPPADMGKFMETSVAYCGITHNCCRTIEEQPQINDIIHDRFTELCYRVPERVVYDARNGDVNAMIEMGLRYYTGVGSYTLDEVKAIDILERVILPPAAGPKAFTPTPVQVGRAASILCHIFWEHRVPPTIRVHQLRDPKPEAWNRDAVFMSAHYADIAVRAHYTPNQLLWIAAQVENAGLRKKTGARSPPPWLRGRPVPASFGRFDALDALWAWWDVQKARMDDDRRGTDAKVTREPHIYICALEECGAQASYRCALQRCGGKCPLAVKPAYCSKACQKKDWKRHKPFCQPDAPPDPRILALQADPAQFVMPSAAGSPTEPFAFTEGWISTTGAGAHDVRKELTVRVKDASGASRVIAAGNMDLQQLRELGGDPKKMYQAMKEKNAREVCKLCGPNHDIRLHVLHAARAAGLSELPVHDYS